MKQLTAVYFSFHHDRRFMERLCSLNFADQVIAVDFSHPKHASLKEQMAHSQLAHYLSRSNSEELLSTIESEWVYFVFDDETLLPFSSLEKLMDQAPQVHGFSTRFFPYRLWPYHALLGPSSFSKMRNPISITTNFNLKFYFHRYFIFRGRIFDQLRDGLTREKNTNH